MTPRQDHRTVGIGALACGRGRTRSRAGASLGVALVIAWLLAACVPVSPVLMVVDPTQADLDLALSPPAIGAIVTESYGPDPAHLVTYAVPSGGVTTETMILFVHGGGWTSSDRYQVPNQLSRQTARGFLLATIDFRMAPAHPFPAPLTDVKRAIRWAKANAARLGVRPNRIVLAGLSSGGHLALLAAGTVGQYEPTTDLTEEEAAQTSKPAALFAGVAPTDLSTFVAPVEGDDRAYARSVVGQFLGCQDASAQYDGYACDPALLAAASPMAHLVSGEGMAYVVYGGVDTLVSSSEQGMPFASQYAARAGVIRYDLVEGADHAATEQLNAGALDTFLDLVVSSTSPTTTTTSAEPTTTTSEEPTTTTTSAEPTTTTSTEPTTTTTSAEPTTTTSTEPTTTTSAG